LGGMVWAVWFGRSVSISASRLEGRPRQRLRMGLWAADFKRQDARRGAAEWLAESSAMPTHEKIHIFSDRLPHRAFKFCQIGLSTA
jgi:hypothetical protein